jgi:hypothetical protein
MLHCATQVSLICEVHVGPTIRLLANDWIRPSGIPHPVCPFFAMDQLDWHHSHSFICPVRSFQRIPDHEVAHYSYSDSAYAREPS